MQLVRTCSLLDNTSPLELVDLPTPEPGPGEVLIKVHTCGVCHTELDEIEGRTSPPNLPVVPGHQVIGTVVESGREAQQHPVGSRVGVGWIYCSDGSEHENLSSEFRATGRDANGGYAEFLTIPENYAYPIPESYSDIKAAPLLCAGAIGYRALRLAGLEDGQPLGLTGFGGSAHIVIQLARFQFPNSPVFVFARSEREQRFALELGATWAGGTHNTAPEPLQAIIDTTPAWTPVVAAMKNLNPGGRLVINAIRKQDADKGVLLDLDYGKHLWMEREIKSVANITARDIREFLPLAASIPITVSVETYPLESANTALLELKQKSVRGAKVLQIAND